MKTLISFLLHHANRMVVDKFRFYAIKNKILSKYGKHLCYDVQFIEGKKCFTCDGTGIYSKYYDSYGFISDVNYCYHCNGTGWYKKPVWNILSRVQFGKYEFHQPYQRSFTKPDNSIPPIIGYIEHIPSKYSKLTTFILFIIYDKGFIKRTIKNKISTIKYRLTHIYRDIKWYFIKQKWNRVSLAENELPF